MFRTFGAPGAGRSGQGNHTVMRNPFKCLGNMLSQRQRPSNSKCQIKSHPSGCWNHEKTPRKRLGFCMFLVKSHWWCTVIQLRPLRGKQNLMVIRNPLQNIGKTCIPMGALGFQGCADQLPKKSPFEIPLGTWKPLGFLVFPTFGAQGRRQIRAWPKKRSTNDWCVQLVKL